MQISTDTKNNLGFVIGTYGIEHEEAFMQRSIWRAARDIFKEHRVRVEKVWIAQGDGESIVAVGDIGETLSQAFPCW